MALMSPGTPPGFATIGSGYHGYAALIEWLNLTYQAGILSEAETGLPLSRMGSIEFLETLVKKICYREGFGNILADGTIRAAQRVGKGSEKFLSKAGVSTKNQ